MKEKYLPLTIVVDWLENPIPPIHNASNYWLWIMQSLDLVKDWITWNPGNGIQIKINEDPIFGGSSLSY